MNGRLVGVALMLGLATGLVTACTNTAKDSGMAAAPAESGPGTGSGAADSSGAGGSTSNGQRSATSGEIRQPGVNRSLVRTATIEMTAGDVGGTVDHARDIAVTEGGYAGREEVREKSATLVLYIPSDRFDGALADLSKLGKVTSRESSADDVTEQVVDLNSRIATQRASVDRVRALLAKASTVDEIVRIEQELTTREADLESLEQRQQALAGQVAMSTVTMRVSQTNAPPPAARQEESGGFLAGLSDGWGAFLDAGAVALRVVGVVLPFALVFGIPAVAVLRWRRRRRTTAPAATQP